MTEFANSSDSCAIYRVQLTAITVLVTRLKTLSSEQFSDKFKKARSVSILFKKLKLQKLRIIQSSASSCVSLMAMSAPAVSRSRLSCEGCTRAVEGVDLNNVRTMIKLDRSIDSMGFMFRCTMVFITVLLKLCVAASTICNEALSMDIAPEHVNASSKSKTALRSLPRSSDERVTTAGFSFDKIKDF